MNRSGTGNGRRHKRYPTRRALLLKIKQQRRAPHGTDKMRTQPPSSHLPSIEVLASDIESVFFPLCTPLATEDAVALKARIDEHVQTVRNALQHNEFLDLAAAEAIADGLTTLLDAYPHCPPQHQTLIVGAVRYFVRHDDAEGDLVSVLGFDDDRMVFNHVAETIGRPELKVAT